VVSRTGLRQSTGPPPFRAQDGTVIDNSRAFCYHDEAEAEECATVAPGPDVSLDDPDAPRIGACTYWLEPYLV
jgi:hypothetical protein